MPGDDPRRSVRRASDLVQTYLDEYTFRYNRRDKGNLIFNDVFERVSERSIQRPSAKERQTQTV